MSDQLALKGLLAAAALTVGAALVGCGSSESATTTAKTMAKKTPAAVEVDCGAALTSYDPPGKTYVNLPGQPLVLAAGKGTSCPNLKALADVYAQKKGLALSAWLESHGWKWLNGTKDEGAALCDINTYDVFVGAGNGKNSQVCI